MTSPGDRNPANLSQELLEKLLAEARIRNQLLGEGLSVKDDLERLRSDQRREL